MSGGEENKSVVRQYVEAFNKHCPAEISPSTGLPAAHPPARIINTYQ